jgi:hypothetical protein
MWPGRWQEPMIPGFSNFCTGRWSCIGDNNTAAWDHPLNLSSSECPWSPSTLRIFMKDFAGPATAARPEKGFRQLPLLSSRMRKGPMARAAQMLVRALSQRSGNWKVKIKVLAGWVSGKVSLLAYRWPCSHFVFTW